MNFFSKNHPKEKNTRKHLMVEEGENEDAKDDSSVIYTNKKAAVANNKIHFSTGHSKFNKDTESNVNSKATRFHSESSKKIQVQNDSGATTTLETETEFSKDTRAIQERALKQPGEALKGKNKRSGDEKLYKGPWKLPFIGSIHHLIASQLPHHTLRDLAKKHGPLMHLQLGEIPTIVISSPRVAQEVLKTHDLAFTNRPGLLSVQILTYNYSDIAFAPYGNYWRQMRKLCTLELLSAKNVMSFASIREEEAFDLVQDVESKSGSVINLTEKIYALTNAVICRAAFGKRRKEESTYFMSLIKELSLMITGFDISEVFPSLKFLQVITGTKEKLLKLHEKFDKVLDMIIEEHKHKFDDEESSRKNNLVNLLLKLQESGTLDFSFTTDNIKAVILDMFLAGTETSATVLDWAMVEMMRNPKVMEKAQTELRRILKGKNRSVTESDLKEVNYLRLVIKETLRLHPPLPLLLPRECREECVINGYDIPIKTKVIVNAWAINRDAEFWEDSESFTPERFINCASNNLDFIGQNFEYLPFGGGRRMCPGISFGLSNVELPLAQLIFHFNWNLPNGMKPEDVDVTETPGSSCSRKHNLCVIATSNDHGI